MNLSITYNAEHHYIEAVSSGVLDEAAIELIAREVGAAVAEFNCRLLLHDLRSTELALESYEIYHAPKLVVQSGYEHTRRALVYSSHHTDFKFFETVSANQGHDVKVFTNIAEARAWLLA